MRNMRRVAKTGGIVSSRETMRRYLGPTIPLLNTALEQYAMLMRKRGADPDLGERIHALAYEVGFEWAKIRSSA
jgi:hypothetical protein